MRMYLNRTRTRQDTTDGVLLSQQGNLICDTAEHTPTRLPAGTYKVVFKKHKGHRTPYAAPYATPLPTSPQGEEQGSHPKGDLGGLRGAYIEYGNGVHARKFGTTIIVGEHLVPGVVLNSRKCFDQIVKRIEKVFKRKQEVELIIR